jgi:hypothetical protein
MLQRASPCFFFWIFCACLSVRADSPTISISGSLDGLPAVYEGADLYIMASYSGAPAYTLQLYRDGQAFYNPTDAIGGKNYLIHVFGDPSFAGLYRASATSAAGTDNSSDLAVSIRKLKPPLFRSWSGTRRVSAGRSVLFTVSFDPRIPVQSIRWKKDGVIVPSQKGASLVLISSKVSDAGNYTAEASNGAGTTTSLVMKLIVDPPVKPVVYQSPFDQVVEVGQSFSFSAYVSEGKIHWRKRTPCRRDERDFLGRFRHRHRRRDL